MKNIFATLLFALSYTFQANAQTALPVLNAESGNRSIEQANCWGFGAVSYSNLEFRITGNYSMRSNQLTSASTSSCWIKTPWILPGSGNITLKARLENDGGTYRRIVFQYVPYDANGSGSKEGAVTVFHTYSFPTPHNIWIQDNSVPIPSAIANSTTPYKIIMSFIGSGGNSRAFVDDVNIPATYVSNPSNSCLPLVLVADADSDGVADTEDDYPNDATKAYDVDVPNASESTLMFEDLWPATGDYDFNDFVATYKAVAVTNADGNVVEMKISTTLNAIGASYNNGFAVQLDNIDPSKILSVEGNLIDNAKWVNVDKNGTELNQKYANIILFDQAQRVLPNSGGSGVNVNMDGPFTKPQTITVTVKFDVEKSGGVKLKELALNPYIIVNQNRAVEVHLPNFQPSELADLKLFGTDKDNSNFEKGKYYVTKNNLPFAIKVDAIIPHMAEKQDILSAYLKLADWATSEGNSSENWFKNEDGLRDNKFLIYLEGVK